MNGIREILKLESTKPEEATLEVAKTQKWHLEENLISEVAAVKKSNKSGMMNRSSKTVKRK